MTWKLNEQLSHALFDEEQAQMIELKFYFVTAVTKQENLDQILMGNVT